MTQYDDVHREMLHDYYDDVDADRRRDAAMEEWDDCHPADTTCSECGASWWGNWTSGSRVDPPEPRNADCPECGA